MGYGDIFLTVLGGGQEIGANSYLLEWGKHNIILDAGLDPRSSGYGALPSLDVLYNKKIHAIIITHAHLDHIGSLPIIFANYLYLGAKIFITKPNVKLIPHMLMESVKGIERDLIPEDDRYYYHQLFDRDVLKHVKKSFSAHEYNTSFEVCPGINAQFFPAGHILGSAGIVLSDDNYVFVYTGDINNKDQTIHSGCQLPNLNHVDTLLIESTHGSSSVGPEFDHEAERVRFAQEIQKTVERGGHTLIPCFGLGRTQDIVVMLSEMKKEGLISQDVPVYYHFGVTAGVNRIYNMFPNHIKNKKDDDIDSLCTGFNGYGDNGSFKSVVDSYPEPSIFVLTSGMLARGTPAAHVAKELVKSDKHGIFFVGYAAPGELGYELINVQPGQSVCFDIEQQHWVEVVCSHIEKFAFSAHSYKHELLSIAAQLNPRMAIWVHGDRNSTMKLAEEYAQHHDAISIAPGNRDTIMLRAGTKKIHTHLAHCRAVIVTVGTSFITNYTKRTGCTISGQDIDITEGNLIGFIRDNFASIPSLSAETNCLSKIQLLSSDFLYFVCGDSPEGNLCGSLLEQIYRDHYRCSLVTIDGLRPDEKAFNEKGARNLIEGIADIINRHGGNAIIHATGGFKAQIALATLLGILFKNKVYYLFEDFTDIVCLPQIPMDFDYQSFLAHGDVFFKLLDGREYWSSDDIFNKLPESLQTCFYKDNMQQKYILSPLGRGMYDSLQRYITRKSKSIPITVQGESSLWGAERDSLRKILNPMIGIIIERMNHFSELIKEYEFSSIGLSGGTPAGRVGEDYLEFIKKTNQSLTYYVHHAASRKNLIDILTIHTRPGTSEYVLKMIGKRVYP